MLMKIRVVFGREVQPPCLLILRETNGDAARLSGDDHMSRDQRWNRVTLRFSGIKNKDRHSPAAEEHSCRCDFIMRINLILIINSQKSLILVGQN